MNESRRDEIRSGVWRSKSNPNPVDLGDEEGIEGGYVAQFTPDSKSLDPSIGYDGSSLLPPTASHRSKNVLSASSSKSNHSRIACTRNSSSSGDTPLQRIKSLTNFHLYLSPSRLAHIDLLTDSDGEESLLTPLRRLGLHPALNLSERAHAHRLGPGPSPLYLRAMGLPGQLGGEQVRSYSGQLQEHHSRVLDLYRDAPKDRLLPNVSPGPSSRSRIDKNVAEDLTSSESGARVTVTSGESASPKDAQSVVTPTDQPIAAYSSDANPWYGYPTIRVADGSIRPRYARNRKRDLVKTLLFLFMLRMQSLRNWFEGLLGLNRLGTWMGRHQPTKQAASTPAEGLLDTAERKVNIGPNNLLMIRHGMREDWIWMVVGFLLMRGTWTSWVEAPLEALGFGGLKTLLGVV